MSDGRDSSGRFVQGAAHPRLGGRTPKLRRIEPLLEMIGAEEVDYKGEKITKLEAVIRSVFAYALKGNSWAVQFIAERTEGKIRETVIDTSAESGPIKVLDLESPEAESD